MPTALQPLRQTTIIFTLRPHRWAYKQTKLARMYMHTARIVKRYTARIAKRYSQWYNLMRRWIGARHIGQHSNAGSHVWHTW